MAMRFLTPISRVLMKTCFHRARTRQSSNGNDASGKARAPRARGAPSVTYGAGPVKQTGAGGDAGGRSVGRHARQEQRRGRSGAARSYR